MSELSVQLQDANLAPSIAAEELQRASTRGSTHARKAVVPGSSVNPNDVTRYGKAKAKKIAEGKIAIEDGKEYDLSLFKAIFKTVRLRWLGLCILQLCGCRPL